jgi:hypothetical protein
MSHALHDTDELDPPTEVHSFDACDATIAGARATLDLHHLQALLGALGPLRAAYVSAAIDPLRALPIDARRAILPHLLREHPALLGDPRVRALADDVLLDTDAAADRPDAVRWLARVAGVRAASANDVLGRVEGALVVLASAVAELSRTRNELCASMASHDARSYTSVLPDDAADVLAWALGAMLGGDRAQPSIAAAMAGLVLHAMAVPSAAREAARALEPTADASSWWTRVTLDLARWARGSSGPTSAERFEAAFARAYVARSSEET